MREKSTGYVLLGALAAGGPMTGYELRAWIGGALGGFWSESFGQIYPALKSLLADGHIIAADGEREGKPYRITPAGRAALVDWLARPPQAERARSELLLKLHFGRFLGADTARAMLAGARSRAADAVTAAESEIVRLRSSLAGEALFFSLITAERGLAAARAERDWAERALKAVDALENGGPDAGLLALR